MKMDRKREELLTQPEMTPQKRTDGKLPRCDTDPCFILKTQDEKRPMDTMPKSTGIPDPRNGT